MKKYMLLVVLSLGLFGCNQAPTEPKTDDEVALIQECIDDIRWGSQSLQDNIDLYLSQYDDENVVELFESIYQP